MKADYRKYTLNFKAPSGTSRGVLTQKETWFLILKDKSSLRLAVKFFLACWGPDQPGVGPGNAVGARGLPHICIYIYIDIKIFTQV